MLPLLRAYPGAVFREIAAFWDESTGTAVLLMEAVGSQNGGLYGVIPATGKTTCVPLFEAARVGPDGKFSELWTCLGAWREGGDAARALRARGVRGRDRLSFPPRARADKFMLIDQIGAIDFLKPMIAVLFANKAAAAAAAAGAGGAPPRS